MVECCPTFLYATTPMTAVAQVINSLDLGGAERVAVSLSNGLATADCCTHLLITRRTGVLQGELSPEVGFFNAERRKRLDWAALRRLGRYIDENEIQLLHAHDSATSVVLRLALLFARRRPIQIVHDHAGQEIENSRAALFNRVFLRHLEGYIAVSDSLRSRAEKLLPLPAKRCIWIPNGIAISPPRQPFDGPPTVIQVANLQEPKGHRVGMRCAALVREQIPELRWLCIGRCLEDTEYVRMVRAQIGELGLEGCVDLVGERHDVRFLLRQAQVGVLSSDFEGLPLAILEYMSESLPFVTTSVGQVPAIAEASGGGRVVPVGDAAALAGEVVRMLRSESLQRDMGAAGRRHVAEKFSIEAMLLKVREFYAELFAERGWPTPGFWTRA